MADVINTPTLQPGTFADMYHAGTRKYYRVTVQHQVTEEEAFGPTFQCPWGEEIDV